MPYLLLALGAWNLVVLAVYGIDKVKAIRGTWRIREAILLGLAAAMGGVGAALGMVLFRHKIRKPRFIWVYVLAAVQAIAVAVLCVWLWG